MDEKVLEEIETHQETVSRDAVSPLHLIREKEMEISGRTMAARQRAEEIVAEARREATRSLSAADGEGQAMAAELEKTVHVEVEEEIKSIELEAQRDVDALEEQVTQRSGDAVKLVVEKVLRV